MRANILIALVVLGACAESYRPIIDMKGKSEVQYEADLAECREYARQVNPAGEAVAGALLGAAIGAALGAATGAAIGNAGQGAAVGTAYGGTAGAFGGGANAAGDQIGIIRRCLAGRGYNVLR